MRRWLIGLLEFDGRHRQVMARTAARNYSSSTRRPPWLPATVLASSAAGGPTTPSPTAQASAKGSASLTAASIDDRLHEERVGPGRSKRTFVENIDGLPDGVFESLDKDEGRPYLLGGGHLLAWSPGGYKGRRPRPAGVGMKVLTQASTVAAIRAGHKPVVHSSATGT